MEKDTLIVFVSDNGGSYQGGNNDPLRGQKATVYDGGVRVPAALSFKGRIPEGLIVNTPLHAVDLYPTLLNLAGSTLQQENPLDGREAWRVICGEEEWSNREILIHGRRNRSCAIRIGDWKLVRDGKLGPTNTLKDKESVNELFNLKEDPSEKKNLVADHPEIFSQLSKRLDALIAEEVPALYDLHPMVEEPTPSVWKPRWWE